MRIVICTNDGTVVETITPDEIGDLSKPLAREALMQQIREAQERIREEFDE